MNPCLNGKLLREGGEDSKGGISCRGNGNEGVKTPCVELKCVDEVPAVWSWSWGIGPDVSRFLSCYIPSAFHINFSSPVAFS
ncbi:hypothetical protein INR49_005126 [Caranx melampygus]|nr:hypothetical protein INR49_005126 [Caranx melampygus]